MDRGSHGARSPRACRLPPPPPPHTLSVTCIVTTLTFIDRANLGLAAPILLHDIHLSRAQYGLAAAVFFISYGVCMPWSALCFTRVGVTLWMAIIVVAWGFVTAAFAAVRGPASLYVLRVLLGAAEAGTMPGCWFLLTRHVPARIVPLAYSVTLVFTVLASVIGAPLGAAFLGPMEVRWWWESDHFFPTHDASSHPSLSQPQGVAGLHGWQWLFICEGALTVAVGAIIVPLLSADTVGAARWLSPDEKRTAADALTQAAVAEGVPPPYVGPVPDAQGVVPLPPPPETVAESIRAAARIVTVWQIWVLGFAVMLTQVAFFGVLFFAPLEIASAFGTGDPHVYTTPAAEAHRAMIAAFKSMVVFGPTAAAMVAAGAWVRVTGDRTGVCTLSLAASAVAFAMIPAAAASGGGAARRGPHRRLRHPGGRVEPSGDVAPPLHQCGGRPRRRGVRVLEFLGGCWRDRGSVRVWRPVPHRRLHVFGGMPSRGRRPAACIWRVGSPRQAAQGHKRRRRRGGRVKKVSQGGPQALPTIVTKSWKLNNK